MDTAENVIDRPVKTDEQIAAERADIEKRNQPKTANEVLARVDEDHNYRHEPIDMHTTGGVQKAIERNWKAIQALADFVDGKPQKVV